MVAIFAPSLKATLGEEFDLPVGTDVLEKIDSASKIRFSHENKELQELYSSYIGEIGGAKAKELFHIEYK